MTSQLQETLIETIEQNGGEIAGTETITLAVNTSNKAYVIKRLRELESLGVITIQPGGGRGHKTIYKRNRNSPGAPIRRRQRP